MRALSEMGEIVVISESRVIRYSVLRPSIVLRCCRRRADQNRGKWSERKRRSSKTIKIRVSLLRLRLQLRLRLRTMVHSSPPPNEESAKRIKLSPSNFHSTLLETSNVTALAQSYAASKPYKHAIVPQLFDRDFLSRARQEIVEQINFTEKETDIYKVRPSSPGSGRD